MFGSPPAATSIRIASMSLANAARQNGVVPAVPIQASSWSLGRNHSFLTSLAFGSAPRSSSAFINSQVGDALLVGASGR